MRQEAWYEGIIGLCVGLSVILATAVTSGALLASCAGTTPQDLLPRVGEWLQRASLAYTALDAGYMAMCFQRESAPECVELDEHRQALARAANAIIEDYTKLNEGLPQ